MNEVDRADAAWDTRELGASAEHTRVADDQHRAALDDAMGMQSISIRLPSDMIKAYKLIASHHGVGYQPLMRDILQRFVKEGLREVIECQTIKSDQANRRIEELQKVA